jgi:hypothetical protein
MINSRISFKILKIIEMIGEVFEKESSRPVAQLRKFQPGGFPKYVKNSTSLELNQSKSLRPQEIREDNFSAVYQQDELDDSILDNNAAKVLSMSEQEIQEALGEIEAMLSTKNIEFLRNYTKCKDGDAAVIESESTDHIAEGGIPQSLASGIELFDMDGCRLFDEIALVEKIVETWNKSFEKNNSSFRELATYLVHSLEGFDIFKLCKEDLVAEPQIFYDYSNIMKVLIQALSLTSSLIFTAVISINLFSTYDHRK